MSITSPGEGNLGSFKKYFWHFFRQKCRSPPWGGQYRIIQKSTSGIFSSKMPECQSPPLEEQYGIIKMIPSCPSLRTGSSRTRRFQEMDQSTLIQRVFLTSSNHFSFVEGLYGIVEGLNGIIWRVVWNHFSQK